MKFDLRRFTRGTYYSKAVEIKSPVNVHVELLREPPKRAPIIMNKFGPTIPTPYPAEMRTQLWPLCCGAAILSGFKDVGNITEQDLLVKISNICDEFIPDHQVYAHETILPKLIFLTLNSGQMASKKIMKAIEEAGFIKFAVAQPRGSDQGFFVRDKSKTFKAR